MEQIAISSYKADEVEYLFFNIILAGSFFVCCPSAVINQKTKPNVSSYNTPMQFYNKEHIEDFLCWKEKTRHSKYWENKRMILNKETDTTWTGLSAPTELLSG
jgi:hypothetical protein